MPDWKQFVRERLKLPKLTPSREAEIVEDVAGQLEEAYREALRRGSTEDEARAAAEQHVPDWSALGAEIERNEQRHESTWAARAEEHFVTPRTFTGRGMEMLSDFVSDSIQALRALRKNPSFAIAAVLTLAIGIGANVSIFSVAETIVFRPLPFPAPDQLVVIWNEYEGHPAGSAPPDYMDRVHMSHTMQSIAAFEFRQADLTGRGEPVRLAVMRATASYFEVLQTKPLLGRVYSAEEDRPGATPVVVLSHEIWQSRFGADRNIIGQSLTLIGVPRTVIGVMPPQIRLVDDVEAWVPSAFSPAQLSDAFRGNENQIVIGRMKNGVTLAQATADMKAIAASVLTRVPGRKDFLTRTHWSASVVPLKQQMVGDTQPAVLTVYAAVMLLLLMACVNVANLLLARATARRREISTRIALGASPARLARLLLTESLILAVTGGIAGLALTMAAIRVIAAAQITSVPRLGELTLHWGTLVYTAFIVLATALLFGLAPIRQMLRLNLAQGLQDRSNPSGRGRRQWTNRVLVAAQLAMALMVLIGAGLLLRTFQNLSRTSPGFSAENRVTFRVAMPRVRYPDAAHQIVFVQQLSERLKTLPGVRSVGFTHRLPLIGINDTATVHIQGVELPPGFRRRGSNCVPWIPATSPRWASRCSKAGISTSATRKRVLR